MNLENVLCNHLPSSAESVVPVVGKTEAIYGVELGAIYPKDIHIHPDYKYFYRINDIALIKTPVIKQTLIVAKRGRKPPLVHFVSIIPIRPIRLPKKDIAYGNYRSKRAASIGWGVIYEYKRNRESSLF